MKIDTLTISHSSPERGVIGIATELYLKQFTDSEIREAHPTSAIRQAVRFYNRVYNISHGMHVDYDVERMPYLGNGKTVTEWVDRNVEPKHEAGCLERGPASECDYCRNSSGI